MVDTEKPRRVRARLLGGAGEVSHLTNDVFFVPLAMPLDLVGFER
jgi:hypothetical protein